MMVTIRRLQGQSIGVHLKFLTQKGLMRHASEHIASEAKEEVNPPTTPNSFELSGTIHADLAEQCQLCSLRCQSCCSSVAGKGWKEVVSQEKHPIEKGVLKGPLCCY